MIQILGKGGFAKEVVAALKPLPCKMGEYAEIDAFDKKAYSLIAIGDVKARRILANKYKFEYARLCKGLLLNPDTIRFGEGTIICHGCILTTDIEIGKHVIINLNCTIGHDVKIGDFCTLSPGANISGEVTIGEDCYIGTNAVVREKISICSGVTIGAGGVVVKDIIEPGIYIGNPAKKLEK
jgi:sugar O-acyltransferase (sialic acid O-acetyltransferase NeuD family)